MITAAAVALAAAPLPTAVAAPGPGRAVVVVSGAAATSPFTTPEESCATGLAAGNIDTAIRQYLLEQGYAVYTSPAMAGGGPVTDQTGFGPFGDCAITLPDTMTVNSTGGIDAGGQHLARFLAYLHTERGVDEVAVVAHSMGGLFSRAAFRELQASGSPIRIRSLTTIDTPWQGSYLADYANGAVPLSDCAGDTFCEQMMTGADAEALRLAARPDREVSRDHLMGRPPDPAGLSGRLVVADGDRRVVRPPQRVGVGAFDPGEERPRRQ
jgi:triacylglycerol lipase